MLVSRKVSGGFPGKISETGSSMKIELQFLLHRGNEKEASAAAAFAASVGADFRIKSMQVLDNERAGEWMPTDSRRSRYLLSQGKWKAAGSPARGCFRMWTTAVITSDGDVVPCCYDKNAGHSMGNLHNQTFREIWHGEKYGSVQGCRHQKPGRDRYMPKLSAGKADFF